MLQKAILFSVLLIVWIIFSGFTNAFFITIGAISCALAVWLADRMAVVDKERHPLYFKPAALIYSLWLFREIVVSSFQVAVKVWQKQPKIAPVIDWVNTSQKSAEARVVYANSITLTPGTVSVSVDNKKIQVHALTKEGMEELKAGAMDKKVTQGMS
jgi:multicomponent Na+:H+ antiporter subunit E